MRTRSIRFGQLVMSALNVAKRVEGETIEIEVTCSDLNQHRRRVKTRVTDPPGLIVCQPGADAIAKEYHPGDREHLVVDSLVRTTQQNVGLIREALWRVLAERTLSPNAASMNRAWPVNTLVPKCASLPVAEDENGCASRRVGSIPIRFDAAVCGFLDRRGVVGPTGRKFLVRRKSINGISIVARCSRRQ